MDILTGLLWGVIGFVLGFLIAALVAGSRIDDERIKAYRAAYEDAVQKSLENERDLIDYLTEDSSSRINKNPFYERWDDDSKTMDIPIHGSHCDCYDFRDSSCNGTKERDFCACGGDPAKCDFYEDVRKKAKGANA